MKISERRAAFVKALAGAFPDQEEITTKAIGTRISGLALQDPANTALIQALVGCCGRNLNSQKIGHLLEKVRARRLGDLELRADGEKRSGRWHYWIQDHSKPGIPSPDMTKPIFPEAESFKQLEAQEKVQARIREDARREEDRVKAKAFLEEQRQAAKVAEAEQARKDAEGDPTILFPRRFLGMEQSLEIQQAVHRPDAGVECRRSGEGKTWQLKIFLRGDWPQRKRRYEQLQQLWRRKRWCSEYEAPFDGDITPALLRGKEIPASASQDPAHYNTEAASVRMATQLALAGISSNELSLDAYAMQQRTFSGWGCGVGGSLHRAPGPHFDTGAAIRLDKFDPLQRPGEPERS